MAEHVQMDDLPGLIERYQLPLLGYATRRVGYGEAEEAVQETWFRLVLALYQGKVLYPETVKSWLYRVLTNLTVDVFRHWQREGALPLPESDEEPRAEPFEWQCVEREALARIFRRMSHPHLEVLALDQQGYPYAEMARLLHTTPAAVKMRMHRAREEFLLLWERQAS